MGVFWCRRSALPLQQEVGTVFPEGRARVAEKYRWENREGDA
jgi:hypothetical protein